MPLDMLEFFFTLLLFLSPAMDSCWETLMPVSVTYYHPKFDKRCVDGLSVSGLTCRPNDKIVALGPEQLRLVREYYEGREREVGAFPLLPCWQCEPVWWGHVVRVTTQAHSEVLILADTGSDQLEADLQRGIFNNFYDLSKGRFDANLQAWRANCGEEAKDH